MRGSDEEEKRRQREELRTISQMLKDRAADLAPVLLPGGALAPNKREWRDGSKGSKSIILTGADRGVYRDFETSDKACDMLEAIKVLVCNGSMREALNWSRAYLGMSGMSDRAIEAARKKAQARAEKDRADSKKQAEKKRRQANAIWYSAGPIAGTMAHEYLRGRGIDVTRLKRTPGVLRFSDQVWCQDRQAKAPAMVASLWHLGDPTAVAVHRTYLAAGPGGEVGKARVESPRSILGSWPGAIIPLQRGEAGTRWRDIKEGEVVAFGEGIEEGLSVALVKPEWRVGAVGFVGNFAQIKLPVWCHIMLCANNDDEGSQAANAMDFAADALDREGHVVRVLRPPAEFKDWNDFLNGVKRGG
jgi:Toprim domain-containing protein